MNQFEEERHPLLTEIRCTGSVEKIFAYADLLERHGDQLCDVIRAVLSAPTDTVCRLSEEKNLADAVAKMQTDQRARLSCNCAERVLPRFEAVFTGDIRPRTALDQARSVGTLGHELTVIRDAVNAAREADALRWNATSAFCGWTVNPIATSDEDRHRAFEEKERAVKAKDSRVARAESAFFAARAVVYLCQGVKAESVVRSAEFAANDSRKEEREWQFRHALKILHLGPIPLLSSEVHSPR